MYEDEYYFEMGACPPIIGLIIVGFITFIILMIL